MQFMMLWETANAYWKKAQEYMKNDKNELGRTYAAKAAKLCAQLGRRVLKANFRVK